MISVEATARFRECIRKLGLDRGTVFKVLIEVAAVWGRPHLHLGGGIRRLRGNVFECRFGRHVRFIFLHESTGLIFDFAGNHDAIRAYLRNRS